MCKMEKREQLKESCVEQEQYKNASEEKKLDRIRRKKGGSRRRRMKLWAKDKDWKGNNNTRRKSMKMK